MRIPELNLALAVLSLATSNLTAQDLTLGQRVRLTMSQPTGERLVGVLERLSADSLTLRSENTTRLVLWGNVTRLEISQGIRRRPVSGLAVGIGVGAGLGALAIAVADVECGYQDDGGWCVRAPVLGAATLGLLGLGIGALIRTERWKELPTQAIRITTAGKAAIGLKVRLRL